MNLEFRIWPGDFEEQEESIRRRARYRAVTAITFVDMFTLVGDIYKIASEQHLHVKSTRRWLCATMYVLLARSFPPPSDKMKEAHQAIHLNLRARTEERGWNVQRSQGDCCEYMEIE